MRGLIASFLLSSLSLFEPHTAWASPFLIHALSASELAENSAGRGIIIHLEDAAHNDRLGAMATDNKVGGVFGIQTRALDTGASSINQAVTSITLQAEIKNVPLLNVSLRPRL